MPTLLHSRRTLADRSFRLANVGDLYVAQDYKDTIHQEHYRSFQHTSEIKERDLSKQLVIDLSHEQGYRRGHIKAAVNLPLERFDFTRQVDTYGGITQDEVYSVMRSLGVSNETSEIILYDNSGLLACRLYFVLRYFGFVNLRILNGGWRAWLQAGLPVSEKSEETVESKSLDLKPKRQEILTKPTQMVRDVELKRSQYVDTRRPEAYRSYSIDGAKNIPAKLIMEDAKFASVKTVRDVANEHDVDLEGKKIICYSSKGLTSTVVWFGLQMAGCDRASVYDAGIKNWYQNFEDKLSPEAIEHLEH